MSPPLITGSTCCARSPVGNVCDELAHDDGVMTGGSTVACLLRMWRHLLRILSHRTHGGKVTGLEVQIQELVGERKASFMNKSACSSGTVWHKYCIHTSRFSCCFILVIKKCFWDWCLIENITDKYHITGLAKQESEKYSLSIPANQQQGISMNFGGGATEGAGKRERHFLGSTVNTPCSDVHVPDHQYIHTRRKAVDVK